MERKPWEESVANQYVEWVSAWILFIVSCVVFVIEMYNYITIYSKNKEIFVKIYFFMPILMYTFYGLSSLSILITFKWSYNCDIFALSTVLCYALAKFVLYEYYLARLYAIYSSSAFRFNTKTLIISSIIIVMYTTVAVVLIILKYEVFPEQKEIVYFCNNYIPWYIFAISAPLDQIISCYSLYLFTKPIVYLINLDNNDTHKNASLNQEYRVLVKVYTLSSVQFITTLMAFIIFAMGYGTPFLTTDAVINSICIALMNKKYNSVYNALCCCTHKLFHKCINICCVKAKETHQKRGLEFQHVITDSGQPTPVPVNDLPSTNEKRKIMRRMTTLEIAMEIGDGNPKSDDINTNCDL